MKSWQLRHGRVSTVHMLFPSYPSLLVCETAIIDNEGWNVVERYTSKWHAVLGHIKWVFRTHWYE